MSKLMLIHDLVNPETGKTYKEENLEKQHNIPIGTLVEHVDTGIRLFVVSHERDCDMTPLYSLAIDPDDTVKETPGFGNYGWSNGHPERCLKVIKENHLGNHLYTKPSRLLWKWGIL